jgi:hypothetical protein
MTRIKQSICYNKINMDEKQEENFFFGKINKRLCNDDLR